MIKGEIGITIRTVKGVHVRRLAVRMAAAIEELTWWLLRGNKI
jgi:hypothetical protein